MRATLVPDRITPITPRDAATALSAAYAKLFGAVPTRECLATLMAQSALETGRWKSIHCFNWGNVKAGPTYEGFYCQFRCNEVINGKVEWFDPPHPQCNFRAYQTAWEGAEAHIRFLQKPRYQYALQCAQMGAPLAFCDALKAAGYFTAPLEPYRKAVGQLFAEFLKTLGGGDTPTVPDTPKVRQTLRLGSRGPEVAEMQRMLVAVGFPALKTDGEFGPITANVVMQFQRRAGLQPDAVCGPYTWAALERAVRNDA